MKTSADLRRAQRMLDELDDIRIEAPGNFSVGVLKAEPGERIPALQADERLLDEAIRSAIARPPVVAWRGWLDVAQDRTVATRWSGDRNAAAAFVGWLEKRWNFFARVICPDAVVVRVGRDGAVGVDRPRVRPPSDVPSQVATLVDFGSALPKIRPHVHYREIAVTLEAHGSGRKGGTQRFTFVRITMRPWTFVEAVINCIRRSRLKKGKTVAEGGVSGPPVPRLVIDGNAVTFDKRTKHPEPEWIEILRLLIDAKGNPMTRATMRAQSKLLREEDRLDRMIAKIRKTLGIPIEASRSGYSLPRDLPATVVSEK